FGSRATGNSARRSAHGSSRRVAFSTKTSRRSGRSSSFWSPPHEDEDAERPQRKPASWRSEAARHERADLRHAALPATAFGVPAVPRKDLGVQAAHERRALPQAARSGALRV